MEPITLVKALKEYMFDGDGSALMAEWGSLTDKDKEHLRSYFESEGIPIC